MVFLFHVLRATRQAHDVILSINCRLFFLQSKEYQDSSAAEENNMASMSGK